MAGDQQKTELALQSMRLALQAIANYGDCLHTRDTDCTCPVCVAKKTLAIEDAIDWRFVSHMDYRRNSMPREFAIVEAWKSYLKKRGTSADTVMSQIIGDDPSVRDWYVATSVIQWLATNCGMTVLEKAGPDSSTTGRSAVDERACRTLFGASSTLGPTRVLHGKSAGHDGMHADDLGDETVVETDEQILARVAAVAITDVTRMRAISLASCVAKY